MEGVEILKVIEITTIQDWVLYGLIISIISMIIFTISISISLERPNPNPIYITIAFSIIAIAAISTAFFIIMIPAAPKFTGKYNYIVQVEDSVNLNEFNKKYEILSEEYANIYTVKERIVE